MVTKKRSTAQRKKKNSPRGIQTHEGMPGTIRTGMPAKDSVVGEDTFESPKGTKYRIIKTTEIDTYDKPAKKKSRR
jgi:hypothetical protein